MSKAREGRLQRLLRELELGDAEAAHQLMREAKRLDRPEPMPGRLLPGLVCGYRRPAWRKLQV